MARPKKTGNIPSEKPEDHTDIMDAPGLPKKDLFRIDEVAEYFDVTNRTVNLWINHGHLDALKKVGTVRITRESIVRCKFKKNA